MSSNATASATPASSTQTPATSSHVTSATPTTPTTTPTTTSPTPSTTPTTPSESTPTQSSSAAAQSTSPSATSSTSTPFSSTAAPTTSSSSSFTSQVATTLYSTDPAGSIVYYTTTVPEVIPTSVSSPSTSSSNNSHTGVIVGAVVGGVAGIVLLALLLFCIRRRARKDEFDGNFDPDRVVGHTDGGGATLPNVDMADEVTPFPPQSYTDQGSSSMRQYGESPYLGVPSSLAASGQTSPELYASSAAVAGVSAFDARSRPFMQPGVGQPPRGAYIPPTNLHGTGPVDWHTPRPGASSPPSTVSYNTTSTRAAKEREAMGRAGQNQGQGLGLTTQPEAAEGSGDVVVHQDAGRAPSEEHMPPKEIPPAYESIRQD